jgi:hypothetical protein
VISEVKVFADDTSKIAAAMEVPPFESMVETDPKRLTGVLKPPPASPG